MPARGFIGRRPFLALALAVAASSPVVPAQDALLRLEEDLLRIVEKVRPSVVGIQVERAFPFPVVSLSGILIDEKGAVATVGLPVVEAERISVRLHDGRSFRARLAGVGPDRRIALLRLEGATLPGPPLGNPSRLRPGSLVVTLGAPLGFGGSVAVGCVSGLDLQAPPYTGLLQTTVPVREGDVGGVVADARGEIVAMVVGSLSPVSAFRVGPSVDVPGGKEGVRVPTGMRLSIGMGGLERTSTPPSGLALPIGRVLEEARALAEAEEITLVGERRRWLGVSVEDEFEPALRAHLGLSGGKGLLVRRVYEGSPAALAGIEPFDVILTVGGHPVGTIEALRQGLEAIPAGGTLDLELLRRSAPVRISVVVE